MFSYDLQNIVIRYVVLTKMFYGNAVRHCLCFVLEIEPSPIFTAYHILCFMFCSALVFDFIFISIEVIEFLLVIIVYFCFAMKSIKQILVI